MRCLPRRGEAVIVSIPQDIAPLVEAVYEWSDGRIPTPPQWSEKMSGSTRSLLSNFEDKRRKAEDFLLGEVPPTGKSITGLLRADFKLTSDDNLRGQQAVRDTNDSIEVIIVQKGTESSVKLLPWINDSNICTIHSQEMSDPLDRMVDMEDRNHTRELSTDFPPDERTARIAATCTVRLPADFNPVLDRAITAIEQQGSFPGWQKSRWLSGQLALVPLCQTILRQVTVRV